MFTQCEKCKAIFRVNLREVTVAKGQLRCGECYAIFDVTKTLSTTMPTAFQAVVDLEDIDPFRANTTTQERVFAKNKKNHTTSKRQRTKVTKGTKEHVQNTQVKTPRIAPAINKWLLAIIVLLILLLPIQIYLNMKFKESEEPLHEPESIQMVNYNVFAHPNESGVLLISATMENTAKFDQPYPVIEVRLSDSQSKVIALRRFRPFEYYQDHKKGAMLAKNQQSRIKLKISDPGSKATRFKFKFF